MANPQREIKFRGLRKNSTEWITGDLNHIDGKVFIFNRSEDAPLNSPDWFEVIPESVGEYTGLKDRKGVDIYEGDIIHDPGSSFGIKHKPTEIVFISGCFWMRNSQLNQTLMNNCPENCYPLYRYATHLWSEVIGNIYQNPELLEVKNG